MKIQKLYLCKSKRAKWTFALLTLVNVVILAWTLMTSGGFVWYDSKLVRSYNVQPLNSNSNNYNYTDFNHRSQLLGHSSELTIFQASPNVVSTSFSSGGDNPIINDCPDALLGMVRGHWVTRPLSAEEQKTIDLYLQKERGAYAIPPTYQRKDGRCGDVPYERSPQYRHMWFKAICNPKGDKPCCYQNRCTPRSIQECRCPTCFDERQEVHAEYAEWQPEVKACSVLSYTTSEACQLLRGANITFVGDSFVRHVYAATAIVLSGNRIDGALRRNLPPHKRHPCLGMHQITGLTCRALLDENRLLCNGTVRIRYVEVFPSRQLPKSIPSLASLHRDKTSFIIMGLGIHDDFNNTSVINNFLVPFLNAHQWIKKHHNEVNQLVYHILSHGSPTAFNQPSLYTGPDIDDMLLKLGFNRTSIIELKQKYGYLPWPSRNRSFQVRSNKSAVFLPKPTYLSDASVSSQLLWIGTHAPGVLKSPHFKSQTHSGVTRFNQKIFQFLEKWKTPYLDTFNFTNGTVSFDGTHYGWGINMLKVKMILTYLSRHLG